MTSQFRGQWTGSSETGSYCVANLDQNGKSITGRVALLATVPVNEQSLSFWTWAYLSGKAKSDREIEGTISPPSVHKQVGELLSDQELEELLTKTGQELPVSTTFSATITGDRKLMATWVSEYPSGLNRNESIALKKLKRGSSSIPHKNMNWSKFKEYALEQGEGVIFRGQARRWALQTSYHRTGHADLISYLDDKLPEVEHHVNAISQHLYNSSNDDRSLGALLNLIQHHGYPTPLLDWTKSPYVAAFFAFENREKLKKDGNVSIFIFREHDWASLAGRQAMLRSPSLSLRTMELPSFGNPRVMPQQSITMYSNVDDIESLIKSNEKPLGHFLKAVEIPSVERETALRDLALMGITWGSLFPDLDGLCKQLAVRHFGEL